MRCPAFPFSLRELPMTIPGDAALIAEYERLRHEVDELDRRSEQTHARLVELERLLPNSYTYPGDPIDDRDFCPEK